MLAALEGRLNCPGDRLSPIHRVHRLEVASRSRDDDVSACLGLQLQQMLEQLV